MTAVIYARYSAGPRQTDQSIEGQLRVCHEYCNSKGLSVIGEYCDRHISGRTDDRPEFQRLIADAKKKKFDAVVVYKTDRFARNKYDSAIYKRELKRCGVQIYYAAEAIPEGPEGIILESLMEGLAEYYSAELAQKIRRGMHESALKAQSTGSGRPLGYVVDASKHFQIDPEGAQAVKTVFDLYIKGTPAAEICEYLNARGFKTSQGKPFNKNSVNRIIHNRKYLGEYSYNGVVIPGGMPSIVTQEVFAMAQAEAEKRRTRKAPRTPKAEYLLSGKLYCGYCEQAMVGVSGTGKTGKTWFYYYCPNNRGRKKTCEKEHVSRDWLETLVADLTCDYVLAPGQLHDLASKVFQAQKQDEPPEIEIYTKKVQENKRAVANLVKAVESGASSPTLLDRLQELEKETVILEGELGYLKNKGPQFTEDQVLFMLTQYAKKKDGEDSQAYRRRIISCFVSQVILWNDKITIFFNISGPDGKLQKFDQQLICSTTLIAGRTHLTVLSYGFALTVKLLKIF